MIQNNEADTMIQNNEEGFSTFFITVGNEESQFPYNCALPLSDFTDKYPDRKLWSVLTRMHPNGTKTPLYVIDPDSTETFEIPEDWNDWETPTPLDVIPAMADKKYAENLHRAIFNESCYFTPQRLTGKSWVTTGNTGDLFSRRMNMQTVDDITARVRGIECIFAVDVSNPRVSVVEGLRAEADRIRNIADRIGGSNEGTN